MIMSKCFMIWLQWLRFIIFDNRVFSLYSTVGFVDFGNILISIETSKIVLIVASILMSIIGIVSTIVFFINRNKLDKKSDKLFTVVGASMSNYKNHNEDLIISLEKLQREMAKIESQKKESINIITSNNCLLHALNEKDSNKRMELLNEALLYNPRNTIAYKKRGEEFYINKEYNKSIEDYNRLLELTSDDYEIYINRGLSYYAKQEYNLAIQDFGKATKLNPNSYKAYRCLGDAYCALGEFDDAIENYNASISIDDNSKNNEEAYLGRGKVYYKTGKYDEAIEEFSYAIIIDPVYKEAYNSRGIVYKIIRNYHGAMKDFDKAIEIDSDYADAYLNRAELSSFLGINESGRKDYIQYRKVRLE